MAAWLQDTAKAFEEISEIDLAIDWARQAADHHPDHQALQAADYWCELLARHRPSELVATRRLVFSRWPSATTAARLYCDAGTSWPDYGDEVLATLAARPDQARMRKLAAGTDLAEAVDTFIAELRDTRRRRARLQQEFDRVRLP